MYWGLSMQDNQSSYPTVIIGSDLDIAGDENYFYYRPGSDASIIFQAAQDYIEAYHASPSKAKSCYTCSFWAPDAGLRCSCSNFQALIDAPWETRDSPRSAVIPEKGCELFQSSPTSMRNDENEDC